MLMKCSKLPTKVTHFLLFRHIYDKKDKNYFALPILMHNFAKEETNPKQNHI